MWGRNPARRGRAWIALPFALVIALIIAACGSSGETTTNTPSGGSSTAAASTTTAAGSSTTASSSGGGQQQCGEDYTVPPKDASGLLSSLPQDIQDRYKTWPYDIKPTPWKDFQGIKGPWKIGLIMFPIGSPWQADLVAQAKKEFEAAKAKGLVTGKLVTYIQPSQATATPEQQIAAIQQMVRDGVNGILVLPLAGNPLGPAIDAAGKKNVPVVILDNVVPNSDYAVNVWSQNNSPAAAGVAGIVKTGNVLVVRGIAGNTVEQAFQDAAVANIKACPGLKIVGTVWGKWTNATAKSAVLQFLQSHPGLKIDAVVQNGIMMGGIVDAFQTAGKKVPPISDGGCQGGDLSWWLAHKDSYQTVGVCFNGYQTAYTEFRLLLRILGGKGLLLRDIAITAPVVTNDNVDVYATEGKPLSWQGEPKGPIDAWCSQECLDAYFTQKGTPEEF
jgi:ribose transport system substrate-binding protein